LKIAMDVHAIGHPKGNFWSYTKGTISQLRPGYEWKTGDGNSFQADVIQTQTPINPGNSGGPLISDTMSLIGINSFGDPDSQGLNYAVATTSIKNFLEAPTEPLPPPTPRAPARWRIDVDEDGREETIAEDTNGDGVPDRFYIDEDGDGETDSVLLDTNFNQKLDATVTVENIRGRDVAIWRIDSDEDGEDDLLGIDYDLDGEIDRTEPL